MLAFRKSAMVADPASSTARSDRGLLAAVPIVAVIVAMMVIQLSGFLYTQRYQTTLIDLRIDTREMRIAQQALVDAEDSLKDYLLTAEAGYLQNFYIASAALDARRDRLKAGLTDPDSRIALARLNGVWEETIAFVDSGRSADGRARLIEGKSRRELITIRGGISRYLNAKNSEGATLEERIALGGDIVVTLQILAGLLTLGGLAIGFRRGAIEARGRRQAMDEAVTAREQVEQLFAMTDMLQSASTHEDANGVLHATVDRLLPAFGGALYVFSNSRDRLDLSTHWRVPEDHPLPDVITPSACWALKRGKAHVNRTGPGALRCAHFDSGAAAIEVPMMARGEVYGLVVLQSDSPDAAMRFDDAMPVITAIADAMSLTLSNIALRDKLRNQALRDALTGLYNRRYMEDMLERFVSISERSARPLAVIMIDLDHFKRFNDEHGHAMGDTLLRAAAGAVTGGLRQGDIACRYGGEELIVLLPECTLADAVLKAELLRARIEALSDIHGVRVTASFGVAAFPETSGKVADLLRTADAALYQAKQSGRNCVIAAKVRGATPLVIAAE